MFFKFDDRTEELRAQVWDFVSKVVIPAEKDFEQETAEADDPLAFEAPVLDKLKAAARERGLWNLFLPHDDHGAGLSNLQYAPLAELSGWSVDLAPEAMNCSAPDTGNMELLAQFGTPLQKERWLEPLLEGRIRSCFSMTEPAVASSDATNISTRIEVQGDELVINGHKWWASGIMRNRCEVILLVGVTDPDAASHQRHSIVVIPRDTPGVNVLRSTPVFGYRHEAAGGHGEIVYDNVRVPVENLLGERGQGFTVAQARLGPGRIHHCMRLLGQSERALDLMCRRAGERVAFGKPLAEQGVIQEWIADSRIEIEQARLMVLKTAWLMDTVGASAARTEISAIKVIVPTVASKVIDRAMQVFGAMGMSDDVPLAKFYADARYLRIGDGPDEVHRRAVARRELRRHPVGEAPPG
jgi:acyl-CoA dehydrogenase